ncbi:type III helper protein HrpK1, partial [Pseudomonas syringae pv. actinidiae ICMP 19079]
MRISSSPFVIVSQPTPGELALAVESPLAKAGGGQAGVQFGQPTGNTQ